MRRRENAITFREAGAAQIATWTLADQTRRPPTPTIARKKKATLNNVKAAISSRT